MATHPLIQFKGVKKSFGNSDILKGVDLSIYKGQITAVIGKSGTGKSVLLKHIIGLLHQDEGSILIDGMPLSELPRERRVGFQKKLSYMFQDNALFDFMDIYHNIALPLMEDPLFPKEAIAYKVSSMIDQLGLKGNEDKYPAQLSGGMRKRVALARALVTNPQVVLFDEPTTGLDPIRKKNVHQMITKHQQQFGFTTVIVSHDIPEIFNIADRIAMLDDGVIKFEGTEQELRTSQNKLLNAFIHGEEAV
jgi:phospholipid/cholesterol/gamma-HCH transport system ATP-binding protein